jgi:hypothetical protein
LGSDWQQVDVEIFQFEGQNMVILPVRGAQNYYRLHRRYP